MFDKLLDLMPFQRKQPQPQQMQVVQVPSSSTPSTPNARQKDNVAVRLTAQGKKKVENYVAKGPEYVVSEKIYEMTAPTINQLSNTLDMEPDKVRGILRSLRTAGDIEVVKSR